MGKPNGPVYAVKIDNTGKAHPQAGLSKADVVYVEQVEGGVTRLAAIYSSAYPKYVGPVRSGRITDIELLKQYGTVGPVLLRLAEQAGRQPAAGRPQAGVVRPGPHRLHPVGVRGRSPTT